MDRRAAGALTGNHRARRVVARTAKRRVIRSDNAGPSQAVGSS
jgi:hypothetical protein